MWLRTATTVLVVAMIDAGLAPGASVALADPVRALHVFARDPTCSAEVPLADGRPTTALALQRHYLQVAEAHAEAAFMPAWAPAACRDWRAVLDEIERGEASLATTLDWAIKRALFGRVLARYGLDWTVAARWTEAVKEATGPCPPPWADAESS